MFENLKHPGFPPHEAAGPKLIKRIMVIWLPIRKSKYSIKQPFSVTIKTMDLFLLQVLLTVIWIQQNTPLIGCVNKMPLQYLHGNKIPKINHWFFTFYCLFIIFFKFNSLKIKRKISWQYYPANIIISMIIHIDWGKKKWTFNNTSICLQFKLIGNK